MIYIKHIRSTVYREWNGDGIKRNNYRQTRGALHEIVTLVYHELRSMINLILFNLHFLKNSQEFTNQAVINHLLY